MVFKLSFTGAAISFVSFISGILAIPYINEFLAVYVEQPIILFLAVHLAAFILIFFVFTKIYTWLYLSFISN